VNPFSSNSSIAFSCFFANALIAPALAANASASLNSAFCCCLAFSSLNRLFCLSAASLAISSILAS